MARHLRRRFPGAKYHVTNRGNGRQAVFADPTDCDRFVGQLEEALERDRVTLYAYCLMPNHFHLFVETPEGNLDRFMGRLTTAYAMYWRHRHHKPGHCFQNRYKAPLVEGDAYALALTRYIHLNPIKVRVARGLEPAELWRRVVQCPWSSAHGYLDKEHRTEMVDYRWVQTLGGGSLSVGRQRYAEYLRDFLVQDDEEILKTMSSGVYAIGDEEFRQEMDDWVRAQGKRRKYSSDLALPGAKVVSMAEIERVVARECGLKVADLKVKNARIGVAREFFVELGCSVGGMTQRAMAEHLGTVTEHAVGKARKHLTVRLAGDPVIRRKWNAIRATLSTF